MTITNSPDDQTQPDEVCPDCDHPLRPWITGYGYEMMCVFDGCSSSVTFEARSFRHE